MAAVLLTANAIFNLVRQCRTYVGEDCCIAVCQLVRCCFIDASRHREQQHLWDLERGNGDDTTRPKKTIGGFRSNNTSTGGLTFGRLFGAIPKRGDGAADGMASGGDNGMRQRRPNKRSYMAEAMENESEREYWMRQRLFSPFPMRQQLRQQQQQQQQMDQERDLWQHQQEHRRQLQRQQQQQEEQRRQEREEEVGDLLSFASVSVLFVFDFVKILLQYKE